MWSHQTHETDYTTLSVREESEAGLPIHWNITFHLLLQELSIFYSQQQLSFTFLKQHYHYLFTFLKKVRKLDSLSTTHLLNGSFSDFSPQSLVNNAPRPITSLSLWKE